MLLDSLLPHLEKSALSEAIRSLGTWSYAVINLVHILSVAILLGAIFILDLRLLGWRRHINFGDVSAMTLPFAWVGFFGAVVSGICMLSVNASEYVGNPFLIIKFAALFIVLLNAFLISKVSVWKLRSGVVPTGRTNIVLAAFGLVSLLCWLTVASAGRMIAYW